MRRNKPRNRPIRLRRPAQPAAETARGHPRQLDRTTETPWQKSESFSSTVDFHCADIQERNQPVRPDAPTTVRRSADPNPESHPHGGAFSKTSDISWRTAHRCFIRPGPPRSGIGQGQRRSTTGAGPRSRVCPRSASPPGAKPASGKVSATPPGSPGAPAAVPADFGHRGPAWFTAAPPCCCSCGTSSQADARDDAAGHAERLS